MKSVSQAFDEATAKIGAKTALIFYGREISFGELREQVDRLVGALAGLGLKKGDHGAAATGARLGLYFSLCGYAGSFAAGCPCAPPAGDARAASCLRSSLRL